MPKQPKYTNVNPLERLHPGEPYFFIRAQDRLSVEAVFAYSRLLHVEADKAIARGEIELSHTLMEQCADVANFAHKFLDWQEENRDKVKLPD